MGGPAQACYASTHMSPLAVPQTMTVYHDGNSFVSKEYTLKVQAVTHRGAGHEERRTVGKARIDLSAYCNAEVEPLPREVFLQLK